MSTSPPPPPDAAPSPRPPPAATSSPRPPSTSPTPERTRSPQTPAALAATDARTPATAPSDDEPSPEPLPLVDEIIDMETLTQILDLDEDETHEFSRGMAWAYFAQAEETFRDMDVAFAAKDLPRLSSLGHFLKGSSAALGISRVQASCERIQHYGALRDEEASLDLSPEQALQNIDTTLERVKSEYAAAEKWLKDYYDNLAASNA